MHVLDFQNAEKMQIQVAYPEHDKFHYITYPDIIFCSLLHLCTFCHDLHHLLWLNIVNSSIDFRQLVKKALPNTVNSRMNVAPWQGYG